MFERENRHTHPPTYPPKKKKKELVTVSLIHCSKTNKQTAAFMIKVIEDINKKLQILHRHLVDALLYHFSSRFGEIKPHLTDYLCIHNCAVAKLQVLVADQGQPR